MTLGKFSVFATVVVLAGLLPCAAVAQGPIPDAPAPSAAAFEPIIIQPRAVETHRFWDTENRVLFATAAALNGIDFAVTRANLQSGGRELNPVVRMFGTSTSGLAANFAGETVSVITISYFFHKTGHHKLERVVSMVNIGSSTGAIGYGVSHRGVKVTYRF